MSLELPSPYRAISDRALLTAVQHGVNFLVAAGFTPDRNWSPTGFKGGAIPGNTGVGCTTYRFAVDYLAKTILSKLTPSKGSALLEKTAMEKFIQAEEHCRQTNARFSKYLMGHRPDNPDVRAVLLMAREKIGHLYKNITFASIAAECSFTSGATSSTTRTTASPVHKYSLIHEGSLTLHTLLPTLFESDPDFGGGFAGGVRLINEHNRVLCVRKKYNTDRTIGAELKDNVYVQKGAHSCMRKELRTVGVNLDDQKRNQDFARLGAATGLVATMDLEMASDTAACNAVEWFFSLVPDLWTVLDAARATRGRFTSKYDAPDMEFEYQKFSSMGNATTFEIESSIFWAVAEASCKHVGADPGFVSVYGDDIIIPARAVDIFTASIVEAGFLINKEKSHTETGPLGGLNGGKRLFRESCGSHYLGRHEVTPFYVKSEIDTITDIFKAHNTAWRWLARMQGFIPAEQRDHLLKYLDDLRGTVVTKWRKPRIPDGIGDGAFIGPFDACTPPTTRRKAQVEGYGVEVLLPSIDTASGVSDEGLPLILGKGGRKPVSKPRRSDIQQMEGLSLRGYLLYRLHMMERDPPIDWQYMRRFSSHRAVSLALRRGEAKMRNEAFGIDLAERGVRQGTILLALGRNAWDETDYALIA